MQLLDHPACHPAAAHASVQQHFWNYLTHACTKTDMSFSYQTVPGRCATGQFLFFWMSNMRIFPVLLHPDLHVEAIVWCCGFHILGAKMSCSALQHCQRCIYLQQQTLQSLALTNTAFAARVGPDKTSFTIQLLESSTVDPEADTDFGHFSINVKSIDSALRRHRRDGGAGMCLPNQSFGQITCLATLTFLDTTRSSWHLTLAHVKSWCHPADSLIHVDPAFTESETKSGQWLCSFMESCDARWALRAIIISSNANKSWLIILDASLQCLAKAQCRSACSMTCQFSFGPVSPGMLVVNLHAR